MFAPTRRSFLSLAAAACLAARSGSARAETLWDPGPPPLSGEFLDYFSLHPKPLPAPQAPFAAAGGEAIDIAAFRGQVVVLNFWATWCVPCIVEMPALDRLQRIVGEEGAQVVAVSLDRAGEAAVVPFFQQRAISTLALYTDPKGISADAFRVRGLPTTFLIDVHGRIVGGMEGPADWASRPALALIRHYIPPAGVLPASG